MKNFIVAAAILMLCAGAAGAQTAPPDNPQNPPAATAAPQDPANMNSQNNGTKNKGVVRTKTTTRCSTERAKNSKSCGEGGVVTIKRHHRMRRMHGMHKSVTAPTSNVEINKTP